MTILLVTSELRALPLFRIDVIPSEFNSLSRPSQVMVDKPQSIVRDEIGVVIGHLEGEAQLAVNRAWGVV